MKKYIFHCVHIDTDSNTLFITRRSLLTIMINSGHKVLCDQVCSLQKEIEKRTGFIGDSEKSISYQINRFKFEYKSRWNAAHRMEDRFFENNKNWLNASISFPRVIVKYGRPQIPFDESTERMKRQKTIALRRSTSLSELGYATQMELRASGQTEASKVVKEIVTNPSSCSKYTKTSATHLNSFPSQEKMLLLL